MEITGEEIKYQLIRMEQRYQYDPLVNPQPKDFPNWVEHAKKVVAEYLKEKKETDVN